MFDSSSFTNIGDKQFLFKLTRRDKDVHRDINGGFILKDFRTCSWTERVNITSMNFKEEYN